MHRLRGSASALHARPWPSPPVPSVWLLEHDSPALVLGSTQPVPPGPHPVEVVRRRSGGGAVYMRPGAVLWLDVLVPAADRLWLDDVGQAFLWVGETWVDALASLGVAARSHSGGLVRTPWSDAACFAGLGPGEVTVDGRKVVGISQRRTREAALFQCAALIEWDAAVTASLLGLPAGSLDVCAAGLGGLGVGRAALEAAFLGSVAAR